MPGDPPETQPPSRRDGGLLLWVICGVLVFAVLSGATVVVLIQNPPSSPSVTNGMRGTVVASATPATSPARTARPTESAAATTLIRVQLTDSSCPDVRIRRDEVPVTELQPYLDSLLDCLMDVHEEPFSAAGLSLSRPALSPASEVDGSGCFIDDQEPDDWAGLYCGANKTIYYRADWSPSEPVHYLEVLTHEFAHHLQHESHVLARVSREQHAAMEEPNGAARALELSRRLELQAECLSGVALGPHGPLAVRGSELAAFLEERSAVPPEWAQSHGTGRAQTRWFKVGAEATGPGRLGLCSTFTAPASLVE